jgi:hypothetical protein
MYEQHLHAITQMEAEEGLSEKFDFIQRYERGEYEGGFSNANNKYHEIGADLSAVFQERLGLNSADAGKLFRSYSEHFLVQHKYQQASNKYFNYEERILQCVGADETARKAYEGLRECYARSVIAPFEFSGDESLVEKAIKAIEEQVNFQQVLRERLSIVTNPAEAANMVDAFCNMQHQMARQLVQARMNSK